MISLNQMPTAEDTESVRDLIRLLSDPAAAAARIAEYLTAANELRAASAKLQSTQKGFAVAESAHLEALAKTTADQEAALKKERRRFDQERLQVENGLAAREKRVAELEAAAIAAAAANEATRAELERRLAHLKAATAAA